MDKIFTTIVLLIIILPFLWLSGRPVFLSAEKFELFWEKYNKYTKKIIPKYKPNYFLLRLGNILGFLFVSFIFIIIIFFLLALWR